MCVFAELRPALPARRFRGRNRDFSCGEGAKLLNRDAKINFVSMKIWKRALDGALLRRAAGTRTQTNTLKIGGN